MCREKLVARVNTSTAGSTFVTLSQACLLRCSRNTQSRFSLVDAIAVGVDRVQRNFEPMRKQMEAWQRSELRDVTVKVVIYEAFVEGRLEAPKHLARSVHDLYFLCGAEIYVASASERT